MLPQPTLRSPLYENAKTFLPFFFSSKLCNYDIAKHLVFLPRQLQASVSGVYFSTKQRYNIVEIKPETFLSPTQRFAFK